MVLTSPSPEQTLQGHDEPVRLLRFGPEGLMVSGDTEMQAVVWRNGEEVRRFDLRSENPRYRPHDRMRSAAFSPDGRHLFVAAGCRLLKLDVNTGEELWRYHAPEFWPFMLAAPQHLEMDKEGNLVASFDNGSFEKWSSEGVMVLRKKNREAPVWFALDEEGRAIVGSDAYTLTVWNLYDGARLQRHVLHDHAFSFCYSPNQALAAVRDAGMVNLWNVLTGDVVKRFSVPPCPPLIEFDPTGTLFGYAYGDAIKVDHLAGEVTLRFADPEKRFVSIAFDRENRLWAGFGDGSICSWNLEY